MGVCVVGGGGTVFSTQTTDLAGEMDGGRGESDFFQVTQPGRCSCQFQPGYDLHPTDRLRGGQVLPPEWVTSRCISRLLTTSRRKSLR